MAENNTTLGENALAAENLGSNTAIGSEALRNSTTANNTAVGSTAGRANIAGSNLTMVGSGALRTADNVDGYVALGAGAALLRTTGSYGISIGYSAHGGVVSGGDHSIAIGASAMANHGGAETIAIGSQSMFAGSGNRNTVIGHYAGGRFAAGSSNVAIGYNSASGTGQVQGVNYSIAIGVNSYTTRSNQISLGADTLEEVRCFQTSMMIGRPDFASFFFAGAGNASVTGPGCLGIGREAAALLTTGGNNIAIGTRAMEQATTPASCIAIGTDSLRVGAGAIDTVAIGFEALNNATGGGGGTAVGHMALQNAVDIGNNTALGDSSLRYTTTGFQNLAAGYVCADRNLTGSQNVYLGAGAATYLTSGNDNVVIGHQARQGGEAGLGVDQPGGDRNVVIGKDAAILHSGSDCIFIGAGCGVGLDQKPDAAGSVVIGVGAVSTRDNEIVIGKSSDTHVTLAGVTLTREQLEALLTLVS